jgi:hypothetical protein
LMKLSGRRDDDVRGHQVFSVSAEYPPLEVTE